MDSDGLVGLHWVGCAAVHICVAFGDWIVWIASILIGLHLSWIGGGLEFDNNGLGCWWFRMDWIGLDCICLVALRFTFALLWMIALFGVSGYRFDCIGGGLDWIGSVIFLLDCIGLGYFNSRSVKNWIGWHWVGCVAFHICVALNDWIFWIEWITIGLHWMWIALDWKLHIFVELHGIALDNG